MDANDAKEIYEHLNNLEANPQKTQQGDNEQITINNKLIKGLEEITNHINTQQAIMTQAINDLNQQTAN